MKRMRMSRRKSKRNFSRTARKISARNLRKTAQRGGYHL